jgi:acyl CoA:acetate/3-ketoacid CoA transferase alpha subunit
LAVSDYVVPENSIAELVKKKETTNLTCISNAGVDDLV